MPLVVIAVAIVALVVVSIDHFRSAGADEQQAANVTHHNAMGFRCMDSMILTSFANQLQQRGSLSPKQMQIVHRLMPKYARQLMKFHGDRIQLALQ